MISFRKIMRSVLFIIGGVILLTSCDRFEYDPNQTKDHNSPELLNQSNIIRIHSIGEDSVIRFALISDSHSYYEGLENLVNRINEDHDIDFVIHAGDVTD